MERQRHNVARTGRAEVKSRSTVAVAGSFAPQLNARERHDTTAGAATQHCNLSSVRSRVLAASGAGRVDWAPLCAHRRSEDKAGQGEAALRGAKRDSKRQRHREAAALAVAGRTHGR
jgi:hypothetical protein